MSKIREELGHIPAYIPGKSVKDLEREMGITDAIKLSSNENPLGASELVITKLESSLKEISEYPDSNSLQLRGFLAGKLGLSVSRVIVGNGSNEIIEMITKTFLRSGEVVVTSDMTFSLYSRFTALMGGFFNTVPLKNFTYDLQGILKTVMVQKARIVFVANPNNPTGTALEADEVRAFLSEIPEDVIVVFDEAYIEYANNIDCPDIVALMDEFPNLITVRTFSKAYGLAGLRVGYGVASEAIINEMRKTTQPFNTSMLAQVAATAAICDKEHLIKTVDLVTEGRKYIYSFFDDNNIWYLPTSANFIFFKTKKDAKEVFESLAKLGVIIRQINASYLRVTIGTMKQNKRFIETLGKVLA